MKVYVCYEIIYGSKGTDDDWNIKHVFFYREDADRWVQEKTYHTHRSYKEMKIE